MHQKIKEQIYVLLVWFQNIKQTAIGSDIPNQVHTHTHTHIHIYIKLGHFVVQKKLIHSKFNNISIQS